MTYINDAKFLRLHTLKGQVKASLKGGGRALESTKLGKAEGWLAKTAT